MSTTEYPRSPEYVAALTKMLDAAKAVRDLAESMGLLAHQLDGVALTLLYDTADTASVRPAVSQETGD